MKTFRAVQFIVYITCFAGKIFTIDVTPRNGTVDYTSSKSNDIGLSSNCSLVPKYPDQIDLIANQVSEGKLLLKITVKIYGEKGAQNETFLVSTPNHWIIATSITGKAMLMLKEYFDEMSMTTLGLGIAKETLDLNQVPENCLKGANPEDIENILREHFLNNFNTADKKLPEGSAICNSHVVPETKYDGKIVYVCCNHTDKGELFCSELKESIWLDILFTSILILQIIIVLYSPWLLPEGIYKDNTIYEKFIFETEQQAGNTLLKFNVKKLDPGAMVDPGFVETKLQSFTELSSLKNQTESMTPNTVYTMYSNKVELRVKLRSLIPVGSAPVTILGFIKDFFLLCKVRDEVPELGECCNASMFPWRSKLRKCQWFRCLRFFMMLIVVTLISLPWLLRVWFYYSVEEEPIQRMRQALNEKNLKAPYTGNLVSYLSPVHPLFLVIYIVIGIEIVFYLIMTDKVKRKVKFIVQKCLRDMGDTRKNRVSGIIISRFLWPLRKFGLVGCIIFPIWCIVLPLFLLLLSLEMFPMLNLSVRFITNFIYHVLNTVKPPMLNITENHIRGKYSTMLWKRISSLLIVENKYDVDDSGRFNAIVYAVSVILTFLTMILSLVIVFECISFYVECAVYTLVGFILYPNDTVKYMSFIFLIAVYGYECFTGVHNTYCTFSKEISSEVQAMVGEGMEIEASKPDNKQENTAFRTPAKETSQKHLQFVSGSDSYLQTNISRLVLFLDKHDILYIPKRFLFQMAQLPYPLCPGKVHLLYLKAFRDFSIILIFLFFVFIVIFAFGQAHDISSAGQVIVALGSGFLPLVFRKFLFQSQGNSSIDKSNLKWKYMFFDKMQGYAQNWNMQEIYITDMKEADLSDSSSEISNYNNGIEEGSCNVDLIIQFHNDDTCSYYVPCIDVERMFYENDGSQESVL